MAFSGCGYDVVSVLLNASTGNQSIVGSCNGQTPKAALVLGSWATALDTLRDNSVLSVGITDGTTTRCYSRAGGHNQLAAAHITGRSSSQTSLGIIIDPSGVALATDAAFSFVQFDTNGITISVDDAPAAAVELVVVLFYGDDLQVSVGQLTLANTINGTAAISGLAFAPNVLFGVGAVNGFAETLASQARQTFGFVVKDSTGTILQCGEHEYDRQTPTTSGQYAGAIRDDSFLARVAVANNGTLTDEAQYELTTWASDGATITTRTGAFGMTLGYLALKTGSQRAWAGIPGTDISTTGSKSVTGVGFAPGFVMALGTTATSKNTNGSGASDAGRVMIGIATNGKQRAAAYGGEDSANPTDTESYVAQKFVACPDASSGILYDATFNTFDADGFTFTVDTAPGTSRPLAFLALEARPIVADNTEQIFEALSFRRGESSLDTEQISDAPAFRRGESLSDTEQITDVIAFRRGESSSDTEQISDQVALRRGTSSGDSEQLLETVVIVRKESSSDSETIVESVYFRLPQTVGDTEQISDAAVLKAGDFRALAETEQIADAFVTKLAAAGASVFSEVEDITEQVQLIQGFQRILSDTEQIADAPVLKLFRNIFDVSESERISESVRLILGQVRVTSETLDILDSMNMGRGAVAMKATKAGKVF